jgi:hypothetical protein
MIATTTAFAPNPDCYQRQNNGSCDDSGSLASIYVSADGGVTWTNVGANNYWQGVASSADGRKLSAVSSIVVTRFLAGGGEPTVFGDGGVYVSTNSGATWKLSNAPLNTWSCIASSADGSKLIAAATKDQGGGPGFSGDGLIYSSTDSGESWMATSAPPNDWWSIAASVDGTKIIAASFGNIYASTNSGTTWTTAAPINASITVACSADGTKLMAAAWGGGIYISGDSGQSWIPSGAPSRHWNAVCSSADGTKLLAASGGDSSAIYASVDSGVTWALTAAPDGDWNTVASSADGYRVIAGGIYELVTLPYAGPWRLANHAPTSAGWGALAASSDGTELAAVSAGLIYTTTDSGASWRTTSAPKNDWAWIASSSDGATLVAAALSGGLYVSTNSGARWRQTPLAGGGSVACSSDGTRLWALQWKYSSSDTQVLYLSTNSGAQWAAQPNFPPGGFSAIVSSADASKLVVVSSHFTSAPYPGRIYRSTDYGVSWRQATAPDASWTSAASSSDATKLVASAAGYTTTNGNYVAGGIFISSDSGATWSKTTAPSADWAAVASSQDGIILAALGGSNGFSTNSGLVYISTNAGMTWALSDTPAGGLSAIAVSGYGSKVVAVGGGVQICTLQPLSPAPPPWPPSPVLSLAISGANAFLSWLVPSSSFILQRTSDLASLNWVDVTNPPSLNFTNLHQEVALPLGSGIAFYRLKER